MDGAIGLAPDDPTNGPSFITAMKTANLISQNIFGIYMRQGTIQSTFMFGDYDRSYLPTPSAQIYYYPRMANRRWALKVQDSKLGDVSVFTNSTATYAIVDSFYNTVTLPPNDFQAFAAQIQQVYASTVCDTNSGICYFLGSCGSSYSKVSWPEFKLQFGDQYVFSIPYTDYLFDMFDSNDNRYCKVLIQKTAQNQNFYVIGQIFIYNYYAIFDSETQQIGFYLTSDSTANVYSNGITRDEPTGGLPLANDTNGNNNNNGGNNGGNTNPSDGGSNGDNSFPIWIVILIALVVVGIIAAFATFFCLKKRRQRLEKGLNDYNNLDSSATKF